ncbi:MAG: DUF504 domain-containing protein [Nanoarchaeota archaeon]|nr:DUF504 domain-containing protein [Nanoarchaeota archaeon]
MKTIKDILSSIIYNPQNKNKKHEFTIYYKDRFRGELSFNATKINSFNTLNITLKDNTNNNTKTKSIPIHRITKITQNKKIIFMWQ